MSVKQKKKGILLQRIVTIIGVLLISAVCGVLIGNSLYSLFPDYVSLWVELLLLIGMIICIYVLLFFQIIIHEAGHLVFGFMSGYKFSSFRIFSFMLVKDSGKLKLKKLTIRGTAGQCLMIPPDFDDGKIPVFLYNLGGSLLNLITALIGIILYIVFADFPLIKIVMLLFSLIGIILAALNGVPMRMGSVDNDGYNAFSLSKNSKAMQSFWLQLKVNEQNSNGIRLRDMPAEWFIVPTDEEMKNSMIAYVGVLCCGRLMEEHRFDEADRLMSHFLEIDSGISGLHRNLMSCDRIYIELINENRPEVLENMLTKEQRKFLAAMKSFLTVLRTEYVYALLAEKNTEKAEKIKLRFEKFAKSYPYSGDVQSERELIEISEKKLLFL